MGYLASPFWLAQLVVGIVLVLQSQLVRPEYFTQEFHLFPAWPRFDAERALALFALTMGILLAPKAFGLILTLWRGADRRQSGGGFRLVISALIEVILSALLAPIMMVIQSGSVFNILLGRDAGWQPQRRDDGSIPFRDIVRRHRWQVLLGIVTGVSAFLIATSLFAWMSPTILGLVLAIPLSWLSGQLALGLALKRWGLLLTPEESTPPPIVLRSNELQKTFGADNIDETDGLTALATDPLLMERHVAMLPTQSPRGRGQIDPDHVVAQAKLVDAESVTEAASWLKPRERMIVQHDRALLALLARLPPTPSPRVEAAAE